MVRVQAEKAALLVNEPYRCGCAAFLLWLPTALRIEASYAILFHEGGVSQFTNLDNHHSYYASQFPPEEYLHRVWVLIDLNPNLGTLRHLRVRLVVLYRLYCAPSFRAPRVAQETRR